MKKQIKKVTYYVYVPQNSGLSDEVGFFGWIQVNQDKAIYYKNLGFIVNYSINPYI